MKYGTIDISDLKYGAIDIEEVRLGTALVWERESGVPAGYGRILLKTVSGSVGFEIYCTGDFTVTDSLGSDDYTGSASYQQIPVEDDEFVTIDFEAGSTDVVRFAASTTAYRVYIKEIQVVSFGDITAGYQMFRNCRAMDYLELPATSPAFSSCYQQFQNCYDLICIKGQIDSRSASSRTDMFSGSTSLTTPNATDITDLSDTDGALWTNSSSCY